MVALGLTTVLALWLAGVWRHDPVEEAIAKIEEKGGGVKREGDSPDGRVLAVRLSGRNFTDDDLTMLEALPDLEELNLLSDGITDDGLKQLRPLRNLRILRLRSKQIYDAGLSELQNHPTLEELDLEQTAITAGGLSNLTPLQQLRVLRIPSKCFTPRGLRAVLDLNVIPSDFPGLYDATGEPAKRPHDIRALAFPPLPASGESLADWMAAVPTLRLIQVEPPVVTDDFLRALARMGKLHMLHVSIYSANSMLYRSSIELAAKSRPDRD
jgi:hypothetical protein